MNAIKTAVCCALLIPAAVLASSHREAPSISNDPAADNTDLYAWVAPGTHDKLYIIANYYPLQEPGGGPNFHALSDEVLYEIHVARGPTSLSDVVTYQIRFKTASVPRVDTTNLATAPGGGKEFFLQLAAGVKGIAKAAEVLFTGGSYGGYLTLLGVGKTPELCAGGMAVVAIADWKLMYEDQADTLRGYQRSLFGGTPDEMPEQHAKSSPITYAAQVRAPVLVTQGENDTRCPARQMHLYEDTLKAQGKEIKVEWFDAGHGSRAMDKNIEHMELKLRWAYRVLG